MVLARLGCSTPKTLLLHGKRALEQAFGLGVAAGVPVDRGEVIESDGEAGMFGAEALLNDGIRALEQRFGLGMTSSDLVEYG